MQPATDLLDAARRLIGEGKTTGLGGQRAHLREHSQGPALDETLLQHSFVELRYGLRCSDRGALVYKTAAGSASVGAGFVNAPAVRLA